MVYIMLMVSGDNKILLRELKNSNYSNGQNTPIKTPEEYLEELRMYGDTPKDQFAHQFKLLFHPQSEPKSQMDLLPPDAILGHVKDSKTLLFLQNDNAILNRLYDMGQRNGGILELFDSLYYSWWQQMRLTGALGASERRLQSFLEPETVPYEGFTYLEKKAAKKAASKQINFGGLAENMRKNIGSRTYV